MIKGPIVYRGYWHNDTDTREALDPDGWFHSGDIGKIDEDGYLAITGRKKELIVTAGGKNVAPAVLEDRIRADVLIDQAIVVGDGKPFIACLVTIDPDCFPTWKADHGKPPSATVHDLRDDPDLRVAVQKAIDEANQAVSHAESIRKFAILPVDLTEEAGQITPTLKLKRGVIMEEFRRCGAGPVHPVKRACRVLLHRGPAFAHAVIGAIGTSGENHPSSRAPQPHSLRTPAARGGRVSRSSTTCSRACRGRTCTGAHRWSASSARGGPSLLRRDCRSLSKGLVPNKTWI